MEIKQVSTTHIDLFIRNDQYNFIKTQTKNLVNGHSTSRDVDVINALKSIAIERVFGLFIDLKEEQRRLLDGIIDIENKEAAEQYLLQLKPYVIPFKELTVQSIKKLFPKAKKLMLPIEDIDLKETSYLCWDEKGSNKRFIIAPQQDKFIGIQGTFGNLNKSGICSICYQHSEVGLFMTELKGPTIGTYSRKGNYICRDSQKCNRNLITLEKLNKFILNLQSL